MKRRVLIVLMVVAVAAGCSKSDILEPNTYLPGGNAIAFSDSPETRGDIVENTAALDEMDIYAYYTANTKWADAGKDEVSKFMNNQLIKKNASDEWSYSPVKYWSNNDGDMFSFFAFSPYGAITVTHNAKDKPLFNYTLQPSAADNDDLLAAVQYNKLKAPEGVNLPFKHTLTRISLKGSLSEAAKSGVSYMIQSVEFHGIRQQGQLRFKTNGDVSWKLMGDAADTITCTATQGQTLLSHNSTTEIAGLTTEPKDLCREGKAIFILPQDVTNAYINLNIIKKTSTGSSNQEETITIKDIALPTTEFEVGQWITLNFTYTPPIDTSSDGVINCEDILGHTDPTDPADENDRATLVDAVVDALADGHDEIFIEQLYDKNLIADTDKNGNVLSTSTDNVFNDISDEIDALIASDDLANNFTYALDLSGMVRDDTPNVNIPFNTVFKHMADGLFSNNKYINSLTLPSQTYEIHGNSFKGCDNLMEITIGSETDPAHDYNAVYLSTDRDKNSEEFVIYNTAFSGLPKGCIITIYTTSTMVDNSYTPASKDKLGEVSVPIIKVNGQAPVLTPTTVYKYVYTIK